MANQQSFQISQITSHSDHPIRNTANEFIYGHHHLWDINNTYAEDKGSLAPNIFSYEFGSPLEASSTLNVTLKVTDKEICGADYFLHGLLDGVKIFESHAITVKSLGEATIPVRIIEPSSSSTAFSLNGDFTWVLKPKEQNNSGSGVEHTSQEKTRLELYWLFKEIHEIFLGGLAGVHIDFLRLVIRKIGLASKYITANSCWMLFIPEHSIFERHYSNGVLRLFESIRYR